MNDHGGVKVRSVALDVLLKVYREGAYSQLALHHAIENAALDGRDVALVTQMVYGTIQRRLTLDYYLRPFIKKGVRTKPWVKELLRLSVYQLRFLDKVPEHAIVNVAVNIAKKRGGIKVSGFVNGVLRALIRTGVPDINAVKDPLARKEILHSHPKWLIERWGTQYGDNITDAICEANNTPPEVTIRVNRMALSREECLRQLQETDVEALPGNLSPDAIVIKKGIIIDHPLYLEGKVSIQDESSMMVARALDVSPGQYVLDACAGPGGKTAHVAEIMNDTGQITALDIHEHKCGLIKEQADRLGLSSIKTMVCDARKSEEVFAEASFDRILIDAPCSGFGVIRRKPEIKYQKTPQDVEQIAAIQQAILDANASLLKSGGKMVYSTCTIDKEENVFAVKAFLEKHPDFMLDESLIKRFPDVVESKSLWFHEGMCQILPQDFGTDGFFIAAFVKR
ncbi:MAG: 16S rRNA (cytosine(967)-C(5))-methyltransferase RsmB [Tuberibacillus sp.]